MPFTIRNYAYIDGCGCETVTWIREFATSTPRRFDAYLIYSEQRGKLVDYLGTHQHLAVDIDLAVDDRGGLKLRSGEQRFYEGPIAFNFPMVLSGVANVCEWFEESDGKFHIEVDVRNALWGPLFGYRGWFEVETLRTGIVPSTMLPIRCEQRE